MNVNEALDRYNEGNPIARWIRKKTPPNYFNRWIMLSAMAYLLLIAGMWAHYESEVYIECTDRAGCIHPVTQEPIPQGYTQGTPLKEQLSKIGLRLLLIFAGFLALNHAYWGITTRGGRR